MNFKTLMIIKAVVCLVLGIPILVVPRLFFGLFDVTLDAAGVFPAWEFGAFLLGSSHLVWFGRKAEESNAKRAIVTGMMIYNAIGFIVTLIAVLTDVMNALGWSLVVVHLFFAIGFGSFLVKQNTP